MPETEVIDCREVACGRIPEMQRRLAAAEAEVVEFLVPARIVPQVVSVLGTDARFDIEVEERGAEASVRFRRRGEAGGPAIGYL